MTSKLITIPIFTIIFLFLAATPLLALDCSQFNFDPTECAKQPACMVDPYDYKCISRPSTSVTAAWELNDPLFGKNFTFSSLINSLLPPLLTLAGLVLFAMIIFGGFQMLTAGTDPKKAEAGKTRLTHAVIGFLIIFAAYWITQIIEIILGVNILSGP